MQIIPIPALKDNYIWLCTNESEKTAWAVDPGEATPVISQLQRNDLTLAGILITHHHADHTAGIPELMQYAGTIPVFGSYNSLNPFISQRLIPQDTIDCVGYTWQVIAIPGHTLDHIAYYGNGSLFCGDTLFSAGCGRVFEGTPAMLYDSLQTLAGLPDKTAIYCGHEYTVANLRFAQHVEPDNHSINQQLSLANHLRTQGKCTLPSQLDREKNINPFLRCHLRSVIDAAEHYAQKKLDSPVEVLATLREWKNNFIERP